MCFVLPLGVGDSDAASEIRKMLLQYRILEVTDLEDVAIHIFPSPQASGRATGKVLTDCQEKCRIPFFFNFRIYRTNT